MDFESRENLWANLITQLQTTPPETQSMCKVCAALEILKIAVCAGGCHMCDSELMQKVFDNGQADCVDGHLKTLRANLCIFDKLEELEKKVPLYSEKYLRHIESLSVKVEELSQKAERLSIENKCLKQKLLFAQAYSAEQQEKHEQCLIGIKSVIDYQIELKEQIELITNDIFEAKEWIISSREFDILDKRVERLDNLIIEEYSQIDEIWGQVQALKCEQEAIENRQIEVKKLSRHCENLDKATETILEFHHSALDLKKSVDSKLQELQKLLFEQASEDYRRKILELRKQTNEYLPTP